MRTTFIIFGAFGFINPLDSKKLKVCDNIATIDIETYIDPITKKFIPYCVALYTNNCYFTVYHGDSYKFLFRRRSTVVSDLFLIVLFRFFTFMQEKGIKHFIVYAHNFSGFDSYFIINSLAGFGLKSRILKVDSNIYFVRVMYKRRVIEFRCSLLLLKSGLNECAQSFGVNERKIPFNHDWVQLDRLDFEGPTPEGFMESGVFNFKKYVMKYCLNDCIVLFKVLEVFANKIREFDMSLGIRSYSIPGLAYKVFKTRFLNVNTLVNLSLNKNINDFIREGYYGGRTEVFMAYIGGNRGYYYDVKGMYAQAMSKSLTCGEPERMTKFTNTWLSSEMLKGFYKVFVSAPEMAIPVLPFRSQEGKLIFPTGDWVGTYYSEELLLAKEYGYSFRPVEAIIFRESKPFLKDYVDYFTKIKEMGGAYRQIGKLFINSLYGRFAIRGYNIDTVLIHNREEEYFIKRFNIVDRVEMGEFLVLTYDLQPILTHYKANGIFDLYSKDRASYRRKLVYGESNVAVSAVIASLGRIHLYRDMMSLIKHGAKIAYCDTDSIFAEFSLSPLGLKHGDVYWDATDPSTTFEEGIFLAPKMYSITRRVPHVKGVKLDMVSHEELRECLFHKKDSLKVSALTQFRKREYNIYLDSISKIYSLWRSDKREWRSDENNFMVTTPLKVDVRFNPFKDLILPLQDMEIKTPDLLDDFKDVNKRVPTFVYSQSLSCGINIVISENYMNISIAANSENLHYLYYTLMGKLSLEQKPIYLKILYKTRWYQLYTLTRYIYSPHINFILSLTDFSRLIQNLIDNIHINYDIKEMGFLNMSLFYSREGIKFMVNHQTVEPFPEKLQKVVSLRSLEEMRAEELKLQDKIEEIKSYRKVLMEEISVREEDSIKVNKLSIILEKVLERCNVLDRMLPNVKERSEIISYFISGLIQSKINSKEPSIQNFVGLFLSKFGRIKMSRDVFTVKVKAAILLLRWVAREKVIRLTRISLYGCYQITFIEQEYENLFIEAFYSKKIFFRKLDHNKNDAVRLLDLTPIALNYEYLDWLKGVVESIERNEIDRVKFGFSPKTTTFKGELLTVKEGLKHYKYIKELLDSQKMTRFYMYWFTDFRGRLYPALTNFSVQSMKVIRWGFKNPDLITTTWAKDNLFSNYDYRQYLIKLAIKYISPKAENMKFEEAVDLIKVFEINGSFDHYEVYLRRLEINTLLDVGEAEISPIPIDGQCNVYQHIAALTRNGDIGRYVNLTKTPSNIDMYHWFGNLLRRKLEESAENSLSEYFLTLFDTRVDLRKLIKLPIMTYPYGLTLFGLTRQIWSYFDELGIKIIKEELRYLRDLIHSIREEYFVSVLDLKTLLTTLIKDCRTISWTLPDGFKVHQHYYKSEEIDISTTFNGRKMETRVLYVTGKLNTREHSQGITPNFIHSYDAYHMREIIRAVNDYKII